MFKLPIIAALPLLFVLLATLPSFAEDPAKKGREIAEQADRRDSGYQDSIAQVEMLIRTRGGKETRRDLSISVLEGRSGGDKTLVRFFSPPDVRGTALLTHAKPGGNDEQWIYLPALRRTKRIPSNNRSAAFMGSEFSYEDFASRKLGDYRYKYLRDDKVKDLDVYVVERVPSYADSGYARQQVWFDKAEYRTLRVEFWDRKGRALKTLTLEGYQKYLGRFHRSERMLMQNRQTGDSTRLTWKNYRFRTGLGDNDFSFGALRRAR
ncbi:MAG TPA: outer membrane lipoprotein-sorting protein [Candidatus Krumholzibacteria bacterium]|jgi:outer membrane lipoprotein-sorting protein